MSVKNYDLHWAYGRRHMPKKLKNYYTFKKFSDAVYELDDKDVVYHRDQRRPNNSIVYNEGSPNFNLFKLTPHGKFIVDFYTDEVWRNTVIDDSILDRLKSMTMSKYENATSRFEVSMPYDLFFMQNSSTSDFDFMKDAMMYATKEKCYTIFKGHPLASDKPSIETWKIFENTGLVSQYTQFAEDVDNEQLISSAKRVYSADSGTTMNSILARKPTFTYRKMDMSPLAPTIKSAYDMTYYVVPEKDMLTFLSWYVNVLCVDVNSEGFMDKIARILHDFDKGVSFEEMFS